MIFHIYSHRSVGNYVYGTFSRVIQNIRRYPYNQFPAFERQDDTSLSLFDRVVGFFQRGMCASEVYFRYHLHIIDVMISLDSSMYCINRCQIDVKGL